MGADAPTEIEICGRGAGADAASVDALAGGQLAARRKGRRLRLRHASSELLELIAFMGLEEVLPADR